MKWLASSKRVLISFLMASLTIPTTSAWTYSPFRPTSIPLAVRSPYVTTWLYTGPRTGDLTNDVPLYWNGSPQYWCGLIRVDGVAYRWLGDGLCQGAAGALKSVAFTASSTTFVITAGPMDVTVLFLSPMTPKDLTRQSLPYSYVRVSVASNDGRPHTVDIYQDITGTWVASDWNTPITWDTATDSNVIRHTAQRATQTNYGEQNDFSTAGQVVFATAAGTGVTWQTGNWNNQRSQFINAGSLLNTKDTNFRAINNQYMAFGYAHNLGSVTSASGPVYSVGFYRDPAISFTGLGGPFPDRSLYFMATYPSLISSINFFVNDFAYSLAASNTFDAGLQAAASSISSDYAGIVALAARQVFGGMEISVGKKAGGGYDTSDIMVFSKEIATSNYVSTTDVNYPMIWFFAYANPDLIRYTMEPTVQYTAAGKYSEPYVLHELGFTYPVASGAQHDSYILEETGNMLIMAYAHTKFSGSTAFASKYYTTLAGWANALIGHTQFPENQVSTDDFQLSDFDSWGPAVDYTNLAIKGVVGLGSMAKMATLLGRTADAQNWANYAATYTTTILQRGLSTDGSHFKVTYDMDDSTWITAYNMFPDRALGLGLFSAQLYANLAQFYPGKKQTLGIPLDSRSTTTKTDWAIMTAAIHYDVPATRDAFISGVKAFETASTDFRPFPDRYDVISGQVPGFVCRPVIGAVFAPLLMLSAVAPPPTVPSSTSSSTVSTATGRTVISRTPVPSRTPVTTTSTSTTPTTTSGRVPVTRTRVARVLATPASA